MKKLAKVFHAELFGKREEKYKSLEENDISSVKWKELKPVEPYYFFVPKDFEAEEEYKKGFGIDELFENFSSGIETQKDSLVVQMTKEELEKAKDAILNDENKVRNFYKAKDSRDWKLEIAKKDLNNSVETKILYRPFDERFTFYSGKSKGIMAYPRNEVMQHIVEKENIGLVAKRGMSESNSAMCFVSDKIIDRRYWSRPGMQGAEQLFPLYLYNPDGTKTSNLNPEIVEKIAESVGIDCNVETNCDLSLQIIDYIYAILHSPSYRERYKEFLKIDFPRIPYPSEKKDFLSLQELGKELRELHLLQSSKVEEFITTFPEAGTNTVEKGYPKFVIDDTVQTNCDAVEMNCNSSVQQNCNSSVQNCDAVETKDFLSLQLGKIYINEKQYFGNVSETAWNFYIGGYQPAQKWLKDRLHVEKNNHFVLQTEDIEHYQKMIVSLTETDRIMREIDEIVKF